MLIGNKDRKVFIVLFILIIIVIGPFTVSNLIYYKAEKIAKENQCTLKIGHSNVGEVSFKKYKCKQNPQLEQKLNVYLEKSDFFVKITVLQVRVFLVFVLYIFPVILLVRFIYVGYRLIKKLLK